MNNLIPFDVEKAKNGYKVVTRDGLDVRIICYDRDGKYPIIALISNDNKCDSIECYDIDGRHNTKIYNELDLFLTGKKIMYAPRSDFNDVYTSKKLVKKYHPHDSVVTIIIEDE